MAEAARQEPQRVPACFSARIKLIGGGMFILDPDGEVANISPIRDRFDMLTDLVAWMDDAPTVWYVKEGDSPILGVRELHIATEFGDPIRIHPTPADWARAGTGVCVLDWNCDLRRSFEGVPSIITSHLDKTVADEIERRLRRNFWASLPRIGRRHG